MKLDLLKQQIFLMLIAVALSVFFHGNLNAQSGTTSISGTIVDEQQTIISGARVILTNTEKGFSRKTISNENGTFSFPAIQPGIYRLEVEMNGFKSFVNTKVRALVDTPTEISPVLVVGDIKETVNVRSDTRDALLNTQDATIGNPFSSNQVTQLPTEARDVINLLTLQPGVTRFGYVVGGRSDQANITLDGIDVNEVTANNIFTPVLRLNAEAIQEFRVTTTNANAPQGRSSGAQISLVTKSGTNELRGAFFLTGRRTGWTANDFFNNRDGVSRPKLDRNIFGGAIGGPIWKDRAFSFYSYEGERTTDGQTVVRVVPLPSLGQGTVRFRNTPGQITSLTCSQIMTVFSNTQGCNPAALLVFGAAAASYPRNSFDIGDSTADTLFNTAGFRFNADNTIENNSHVLRLDFNLNGDQQMFFRGNYIDDFQTTAPQFPDTPVPSLWSHPYGFAVGHNWTVTNNIVNNFRYGLSRNAQTSFGDSSDNAISFSNVYSPRLNRRSFFAVDRVHNITDDISWLWRTHTFQFGTNIRFMRSQARTFAGSLDAALVAAAFYPGDGNSITNRLNNLGYQIPSDQIRNVQNGVAAVVGRYSSYTARFTYLRDGVLQPAGTPRDREFKSEAYDFYIQDIWKVLQNLTITAGLRYDLSRPIYEASGYEVKPNIALGEYFERRAYGAANGTPYNQPIVFELAGPVNGRSPLYKWDTNNFQPRIAGAWSPNFVKGPLNWLFGKNNESVLRGGFSVTNDYLTPALVARYDTTNFLGFSSSSEIPLYFYNLNTTNPGPLFTGFNQNIRNLPNLAIPAGNLTFPIQPQAEDPTRPTAIEIGFDENRVSPINYSWNLTYERTLPAGLIVSVSYLGRKARNLLQSRDAAAVANFVDTQSGMDWNTAATQLEILRQQGVPILQIAQIPYFADLFPADLAARLGCNGGYNQTQAVYALVFRGTGSCGKNDWTTAQLDLSLLSSRYPGEHIFYQPQFGTYAAWSSIGKSDYQGLTFTLRQRLGTRLTMDINYTFSKSSDDGSGLQNSSVFSPAGFTVNPFRQEDMYAASDFDMRHIVNANAIVKVPIGRGEPLLSDLNKFANVFLGGWQLTGIFRYNSGLPISAPIERNRWTTNWTAESYATRTADVQTCPTRGGSLFGCNTLEAYRSFRNAYPGETGERNIFRLPGYWALDMGLGKTLDLPWENHKFQFRWEVFNVTNMQAMGNVTGNTVELDPHNAAQVPTNFATFTAIQGSPRSMQFVLRYSF